MPYEEGGGYVMVVWVYVERGDGETALMWTIVGSPGEFRGWQVRLCWHTGISDGIVSIGKNSKNELEELSVTSLRGLWQQLIHRQTHTHTLLYTHTFKDTVPHASNGVRNTLRSPMSQRTPWLSLIENRLKNESCHLWPPAEWLLNRLKFKEMTFTFTQEIEWLKYALKKNHKNRTVCSWGNIRWKPLQSWFQILTVIFIT